MEIKMRRKSFGSSWKKEMSIGDGERAGFFSMRDHC